MSEYPIVRVVADLPHRWELQVNPDGTKTLLVREGVQFTPGAVDMINDIQNERQRRAPRSTPGPQLGAAGWGPPGQGRSATITKLIADIATRGQHAIFTSDAPNGIDKLIEHLIQPRTPPDDEPPCTRWR